MRFECLSGFGVLRVLVRFWGGSFHFFSSFCPPEPPAQCRARVRVKKPLSESQGCRFFVVQFRPADALLSPESGGDQSTLFARNEKQVYVHACVSSYIFFCVLYLFYVFFRLNTSPPRGAVSAANFHSGYLSFLRLTPRHADGPRKVFHMIFPLC